MKAAHMAKQGPYKDLSLHPSPAQVPQASDSDKHPSLWEFINMFQIQVTMVNVSPHFYP